MKDLLLWRMLEPGSPVEADALPLLGELAERPLAARVAFLARLRRLAGHQSPPLRAAALAALAGASGSATFQSLAKGLHDDVPEVRLAALTALRTSSEDDPPRMVHALFHRDPDLRTRALAGELALSSRWMTLYLLPDSTHTEQILLELPKSGLPSDALPAVFDMLAAGSITPGIARDVLLRMRPAERFERLRHGRGREMAAQDRALEAAWSSATRPDAALLAPGDDAFDDAIDLYASPAGDSHAEKCRTFCGELIAWLAQAKVEPRRRVACSLLRQWLLAGELHGDMRRALMVAWPRLTGCVWLPAAERREAALVLYDLKDQVPHLPEAEVKELLERAPPLRRSGNLDLRLLGALGRLLDDSPLGQMIEWYGHGRIAAAFEEDVAESAPFLTLPCSSANVRRGLVEEICADKRPRLPKILASLLHQLSADLFDMLDPLTPYEVTPLLEELRRIALAHPELRFGDHRHNRLAEALALKIVLYHSAYSTHGEERGAAVIPLLNTWVRGPRSSLDILVRDIVMFAAREPAAEEFAPHLLRLEPAALLFLLVDLAAAELLPVGVERLLREALAGHANTSLRQWAEGIPAGAGSDRRSAPRFMRKLAVVEQARFIDCGPARLTALLLANRDVLLQGLAEPLSRRRGDQPRSVLAAESLLVCDDALPLVDAALDMFLPADPEELAELDEALVARCQSQMAVGLGAHLWLYRWEEHLLECHRRLEELEQTLEGLLRAALELRTHLLAEHCFRAAEALLAQWRYRDKPKFHEHATRELARILVEALPGPFGELAAKMLMRYVQVGVDDSLLAELRSGVIRKLPDLTAQVRLILADWISAAGLGSSLRKAVAKMPPNAELVNKIRHSRILNQLAAWAAGDDLALADEAILRLVELGELGVNELAELLERPELPPAAATIATTLSLWPAGGALERAAQIVSSRRLPPDIQFEASLALVDRGSREHLELALEAALADPGYGWFKLAHWQRLERCGCGPLDLAMRLVVSPQPHAYIASVTMLLAQPALDQRGIDALRRFLEQGDERSAELRVEAARRLHKAGILEGFPLLVAQETSQSPRYAELLAGARAELAVEAVDALLAAGPRHARESMLLGLLVHPRVDGQAREAGLRQLFVHGQNDAVRNQVLAQLRRTRARDAKLQRVAQAFAWGVLRARELTGQLFSVEMIGGDDLGYTRFQQPKVHVNPLAILRGEPHGEDIVRALLLHEFGHHLYHAGDAGQLAWKQAQDDRIYRLLNLVADEHLERNLRAQDASFGDPLKRLAAYAFQHARKEVPVTDLLQAVQGRALAVLTRSRLIAAKKPGHVGIDSGVVLRELERTGHSFARFVRALRMGLGNRHGDPEVSRALELFRAGFRHSTMPQLLEISRGLQGIFGWQVMMLDVLGQDSLTRGDASELTVEGEGLGNDEVEREVRRILDPKRDRNSSRDKPGGRLWINVNPDEAFAEITAVEPIPFQPEKHREYAAVVRRPALKMREFFEKLGLTHVAERRRLQGRSFDRSRALAMVLRGEPRVLIARRLESMTDLFLGVVIDCSGSMQSGNNIEKARRFGELLAEAVRGCRGIDLRVFGFTDQVIYDAGDAGRCSVHGLIAGGGNNDAAALWHAAQVALNSRRRAKLLVMISDGLPTECSVAALKALVQRLSRQLKMCCAQVAVRPIEEACFPNYIELNESDLDGSVRSFGRVIVELIRKTLTR